MTSGASAPDVANPAGRRSATGGKVVALEGSARAHDRLEADRLHPLRVQLRARGRARGRGRAAPGPPPRRQAPPRLEGLRLREGAPARPLPERPRPGDHAAAPARRRHLRGHRLGHRHPGGGGPPRRGARRARRRRRSSITAAAARGTTCPAPTPRPRAARSARRFRSSALAQEKTGEFWVAHRMFGTAMIRADFEHCDVALFLGKNPWQSHSIPRARVTLKEIAEGPGADARRRGPAPHRDRRDGRHPPRRSSPGPTRSSSPRSSAILLEEGLWDRAFLAAHAADVAPVEAALRAVPIAAFCARTGLDEALVRRTARVLGKARALASFEDLGVQMNRGLDAGELPAPPARRRSPAASARRGRPTCPPRIVAIASGASKRRSPVVGAPIVGGLVPCNVIADEILTDHPARYRAMIVEAANPAHSVADSPRFREALSRARHAGGDRRGHDRDRPARPLRAPGRDPVREGRGDLLQLRLPPELLPPAPAAPPAARGSAARGRDPRAPLPGARRRDRGGPRPAPRRRRARGRPPTRRRSPSGPLRSAPRRAWRRCCSTGPCRSRPRSARARCCSALAMRAAMQSPASLARAGFGGSPLEAGAGALRRHPREPVRGGLLGGRVGRGARPRSPRPTARSTSPSPTCSPSSASSATRRPAPRDPDFPFVLSAGERRSFTANTIIRDPAWRKTDAAGALRMSPGGRARARRRRPGTAVRITTRRGSARGGGGGVGHAAARPRLASPTASGSPDGRSGARPASPPTSSPRRGPRSVRRDSLAQARAGPRRAGLTGVRRWRPGDDPRSPPPLPGRVVSAAPTRPRSTG